jgi:hypothetical protein
VKDSPTERLGFNSYSERVTGNPEVNPANGLQRRHLGKFDSQLTNRTMYSFERKWDLCCWRCLMPDACSEWQQFLAFRGSLPAKREALQVFHRILSDPTRLWEPLHLVRPYETLGTATSRQALRDSGNRYISSGPSRLWEPRRLVGPFETLGTTTSRQTLRDSGNPYILSNPSRLCEPYTVPTDEGFCVMLSSIEKGSGRWDRSLPHA